MHDGYLGLDLVWYSHIANGVCPSSLEESRQRFLYLPVRIPLAWCVEPDHSLTPVAGGGSSCLVHETSLVGWPLYRRSHSAYHRPDCIHMMSFILKGTLLSLYMCINSGCVGVGQSQNVQFISENPRQATITCRDFPGTSFDNLEVCDSVNVSFTNIRFENCGPVAPNIFVNYSRGIVFDGCHFK